MATPGMKRGATPHPRVPSEPGERGSGAAPAPLPEGEPPRGCRAGVSGPAPERMALVLEAGPGDAGAALSAFLAGASGLSRRRIKEAMECGAVWRERGGRRRRVRRASAPVRAGDRIRLHWDRDLLARRVPDPELVADRGVYSVWNKPPGMPTQGTLFGDHLALERRIGHLLPGRTVRLVHRLDREASGLVVVAHAAPAAAALAREFRERRVEKIYLVRVRGLPSDELVGRIDLPLEGREALTRARVLERDREGAEALLEVRTETGRRHQIRRHLAAVGHPVLGDPRYGRGNTHPGGLALRAIGLVFTCPRSGDRVRFALPPGPAPPGPGEAQGGAQPPDRGSGPREGKG